jgi:hypothetical protein
MSQIAYISARNAVESPYSLESIVTFEPFLFSTQFNCETISCCQVLPVAACIPVVKYLLAREHLEP